MASTTVPTATSRTRAAILPGSAALGIACVTAVAVAVVLSTRLTYVPMWDGFEYASAINRAATGPIRFENLRLAGHASYAYAVIAIAAQAIAPGQAWPILLANTLLLVLAIAGFWRLSALVFPAADLQVERSLLTAAVASQPALLAAVVQPGLDLPVVPAFVWAAVFLLRGRWLAAAITGVALAFTKETGVLLYAVLAASVILWRPRIALGTAGTRGDAVGRVAVLAIPGVTFALYLLYRAHSVQSSEPVVWNAGTAMIGQSLVRQLLVPRIDRYVATSLSLMFVLNFAWVASLGAAAWIVAVARRRIPGQPHWRAIVRAVSDETGFIVLVTIASAFALSRFATYANARYVLVMAPLLALLLCAGLLAVGTPRTARRLVLALYAFVSLVSCVRTIDPVSRALFGTFPFGRRDLLDLTSITHECCGQGRDQLGYNLEFTTLATLIDDALAATQPGDSTTIVLPDSTNWHVIPLLDARSGRRTIDASSSIVPPVVEADSASLFASERPTGLYIALPNGPAQRGIDQLSSAFVVGPERRFTRGPYSLSVYRLTSRVRRPDMAPPSR